jgi:hypothetical protein
MISTRLFEPSERVATLPILWESRCCGADFGAGGSYIARCQQRTADSFAASPASAGC